MVDLYKRLYQNNQQMLAKYFYPKYNNRFSIDPMERFRLEEYKRQYLDWREWDAYILYNVNDESSRYGPLGHKYLHIFD